MIQAAVDSGGCEVSIKALDERSAKANRAMWASLRDVSRQVSWHGQTLKDWEWKDVFTASLLKQKVVPSLDGGFVVIGTKTSRMPKKLFGELMNLIHAFGSERGVSWSDPNFRSMVEAYA